MLVPLRGTKCGGVRIYPQLRCSAACSGFHIDVSLQDTAHLTHAIAHLHMAQCISHMTQPSPIAPPMFRDAGPTIRNPLQAAKQRRCGSSNPPTPPRFRDAGPTIRNPLQAAKQRRCGSSNPPTPPRFRDTGPTIRNPLQAAKQRRCGSSNPPTPHRFRVAGL